MERRHHVFYQRIGEANRELDARNPLLAQYLPQKAIFSYPNLFIAVPGGTERTGSDLLHLQILFLANHSAQTLYSGNLEPVLSKNQKKRL